MPLSSGQVLRERYRIEDRLGQGGMGAVYRAWDQNLSIPVVVKENLIATQEAQRQFRREAGLLATLRHPNLARVTDHFYLPGQGQYLVMDYVDGDDLNQVLGRHGGVEESLAVDWIGQVLLALGYLHGNNVIHRDVKPANIKITPQGQVFLVDFGLAKLHDPSQETSIGARGMTPGYAPPEQYGQGRTDARTDIFSVGATLYALLTGQQPPDAWELVARRATLVPPRQLNAGVSAGAEAAVLKAMQMAPDDRFQTARQFRQALLEPLTQPPVVASGSQPVASGSYASAKPAAPKGPAQPLRRPFVWLSVAGAIAVVAIVVIWRVLVAGGGVEPGPEHSQVPLVAQTEIAVQTPDAAHSATMAATSTLAHAPEPSPDAAATPAPVASLAASPTVQPPAATLSSPPAWQGTPISLGNADQVEQLARLGKGIVGPVA